eukprot:338835_1
MSEQFYLELQTAFEEQYKVEQPFTISYPCPNADAASAQTLINEIDERIITILEQGQQAMEANIALMTAFKEITFLVFTATNIIHESFPNENQILNYHHLLYHFAIYGCCLNKEYRKYMVPHPDVDHKPFKHLSQLLVQSTSRDKPTETRTTIIEQVAKHCDMDIARLIADFTSFEFEDSFFFVSMWIALASGLCMTHTPDTQPYHHSFGVCYALNDKRDCMLSTVFVPQLLTSSRFISADDRNIEYFANQMMFKLMLTFFDSTPEDLSALICDLFRYKISINWQPWNNWVFLAELFETLVPKYVPQHDGITAVLERCVEGPSPPLSIFCNGNNEVALGTNMEYKDMKVIHDNIDGLFSGFINRYCISSENIIRRLSKQMRNSMGYFEVIQFNCNGRDEKKELIQLNAILKRLHAYHYCMVQSIQPISEPPRKRVKLNYNVLCGPLCAAECVVFSACCYEYGTWIVEVNKYAFE